MKALCLFVRAVGTAKARLNQLADAASARTPQIVTRHGENVVIVIATKPYAEKVAQRSAIAELFARSPLTGIELDMLGTTSRDAIAASR